MINPVSESNTFDTFKSKLPEKVKKIKADKNNSFALRYADSFVRHSVESVPVLGGLTLFWSFIDKSKFGSLKKAIGHNAKNFMLPVMVITSAVTAFIENKKTKEKEKNSEK